MISRPSSLSSAAGPATFARASVVVTDETTLRQPASGTSVSSAGSARRSPGASDASTRLSANESAETSVP